MGELTVQDIEKYNYKNAPENFAESVVDARDRLSSDDMVLLQAIEDVATGGKDNCFGKPRWCTSDRFGEVLEISLYGACLDVREIQHFIKGRCDLLLGEMLMTDEQGGPARLVLIIVPVGEKSLWA